jgi:uncharacterized repeat protein (TIGR02543 family)
VLKGNGAEGEMADVTIKSDETVKLPINTYTIDGYYFAGWSKSSYGGKVEYADGDEYTMGTDSSYTLYAVWEENPIEKVLNFNANTGEGAPASVSCTSVGSCDVTIPEQEPTKDGFTFKGWADTNDATTAQYQPNTNLTLSGDKTIYAVWEEKPDYTPVSSNEFSLRTDKYAGVRFKASVTNEQKTQLSEYGFIVTLSDILGDAELTHDCGKTFVEGKCYDVVTGTDYVFEATDENVFFTAVLYNIPASADNYKKTICARPFTKIGGSYTYGNVMEVSVLDIAKAYRDGGYKNLTDDAISYIQGVLTLCGENV